MAPASIALSTNSLTDEAKSVIAWPATRRLMELEDMGLMSGASSSSCPCSSLSWAAALAAVLSSCVIVSGTSISSLFYDKKIGVGEYDTYDIVINLEYDKKR